jgi:hypothetical protein
MTVNRIYRRVRKTTPTHVLPETEVTGPAVLKPSGPGRPRIRIAPPTRPYPYAYLTSRSVVHYSTGSAVKTSRLPPFL